MLHDLVFVGGGFAATATLASLVDHLCAHRSGLAAPLSLAVIDPRGDFGAGYAYGKAASYTCLLNEPVSVMMASRFVPWLVAHRNRWLNALERAGHAATENWLRVNRAALNDAELHPDAYLPLHLPRYVFGQFLQDLLNETIQRAQQQALANTHLLRATALAICRQDTGGFRIELSHGDPLFARCVVLAVGSSPAARFPELDDAPGYCASSDRLHEGSAQVSFLAQRFSRASHPVTVLILGSNAAAVESLYLLRHMSAFAPAADQIVMVSSSGVLPDLRSARTCSIATRVTRLFSEESPDAQKLFQAAADDIAEYRAIDPPDIRYGTNFSSAFDQAFGALPGDEKRRFVDELGARFARLNRHAPPEYVDAARSCLAAGTLCVVEGSIEGVSATKIPGEEFSVRVRRKNGTPLQLRGAILLDCRGSGPLRSTADPLLRSVLDPGTGIARVNASGRGIRVNGYFEANPSLYVIGPLLAGHSSDTDWLWNLESAPRIYSVAGRLGSILAARLSAAVSAR